MSDSFFPTADELIGRTLDGRYRMEAVLAMGGMGLLFRGTDARTNRSVAVKLMKPHDRIDRARVKLFLREVEIAARLRHPHIVDVLDLGTTEDGRAPYLVMELLDGCSLHAELERRERLPLDEALTLLLPVMDALACVHDAGIVHRDVKPANIFLSRDRYRRVVPKLLDFGIAKALDQSSDTMSSAVFGTPSYMAPEQLRQETIGPAADVWAIGAVFYRCLSGAPPYAGNTVAEVIAKLATGSPESLEVEGVPRAVCARVDRALVREPASRYADMRSFAGALTASARTAGVQVGWSPVLESAPPGEERTERQTGVAPTTTRSSSKARWMVASVVISLVLGILWSRQRGTDAPEALHTAALPVPQARKILPLPNATPIAPMPAEAQAVPKPQTADTPSRSRASEYRPPREQKLTATGRASTKAAPPPSAGVAAGERPPKTPVFVADLPVASEW